jgi:hypothetical protein
MDPRRYDSVREVEIPEDVVGVGDNALDYWFRFMVDVVEDDELATALCVVLRRVVHKPRGSVKGSVLMVGVSHAQNAGSEHTARNTNCPPPHETSPMTFQIVLNSYD